MWESSAAGSGASAGNSQLRLGRQRVESVLHMQAYVEVGDALVHGCFHEIVLCGCPAEAHLGPLPA